MIKTIEQLLEEKAITKEEALKLTTKAINKELFGANKRKYKKPLFLLWTLLQMIGLQYSYFGDSTTEALNHAAHVLAYLAGWVKEKPEDLDAITQLQRQEVGVSILLDRIPRKYPKYNYAKVMEDYIRDDVEDLFKEHDNETPDEDDIEFFKKIHNEDTEDIIEDLENSGDSAAAEGWVRMDADAIEYLNGDPEARDDAIREYDENLASEPSVLDYIIRRDFVRSSTHWIFHEVAEKYMKKWKKQWKLSASDLK